MDTNSISSGIDFAYGKVHIVTTFVRDLITKIIGYIPGVDARLFTIILMLILSIFLAKLIAKRYVVKPWAGNYFVVTSVLALLWFLLLTYI